MPKPPAWPPTGPASLKGGLEWFARTYPEDAYAKLLKVRDELVAQGYPEKVVREMLNKQADQYGLPHLPKTP